MHPDGMHRAELERLQSAIQNSAGLLALLSGLAQQHIDACTVDLRDTKSITFMEAQIVLATRATLSGKANPNPNSKTNPKPTRNPTLSGKAKPNPSPKTKPKPTRRLTRTRTRTPKPTRNPQRLHRVHRGANRACNLHDNSVS